MKVKQQVLTIFQTHPDLETMETMLFLKGFFDEIQRLKKSGGRRLPLIRDAANRLRIPNEWRNAGIAKTCALLYELSGYLHRKYLIEELCIVRGMQVKDITIHNITDDYRLVVSYSGEQQPRIRSPLTIKLALEKPKCASIFLLTNEDDVLLLLRDKHPILPEDAYPNTWDVPGGHMEKGESPLQCIGREIWEELGLYIADPVLWRVIEFPDRIDHVFWERLSQKVDVNELNKVLTEGQRVCLFSLWEIKDRNMQLAYGWTLPTVEFLEERWSQYTTK